MIPLTLGLLANVLLYLSFPPTTATAADLEQQQCSGDQPAVHFSWPREGEVVVGTDCFEDKCAFEFLMFASFPQSEACGKECNITLSVSSATASTNVTEPVL